MPGDVVANLEHATLDSDVKLINQVIHDIRTHDAALADALAGLAHEFDYDTILRVIQEAKEEETQPRRHEDTKKEEFEKIRS